MKFGYINCLLLWAAMGPAMALAEDVETAETIVKKLAPAAGLKLELFAREPMLRNPVCFAIDERGRFFVAETYRFKEGVTDIRDHPDWLDEDLACRTVADQIAMFEKRGSDYLAKYSQNEDRIRRIEDTDGDGKADNATTFSDGYRGTVSGVGAGLLARGKLVWYTNIPDLWLLIDHDNDGVANRQTSLHTGYGVHLSFIGHDLHGLTFGPDGKIYFSVGDRGMNVEQPERIASPDTGAVLRCNLDGSNLELYATGLRNPQELAFDAFGNLWTCDNNSDSGDLARLVYVVEGGDSGWRIGYQSLDDRGPWNREKLWHVGDYAASQLPPIAHVGHGPSGLAFYPGTGLPAEYDDHFFLANFPGNVLAFSARQKGASFEVADSRIAIDKIWATDVDFGRKPGLYVLDWVYGWDMPEKGRIFRLYNTETDRSPIALETTKLLEEGMEKGGVEELAKLLGHADRRVRQEAQFALARRGRKSLPILLKAVQPGPPRFARLHALWALGQIGHRSDPPNPPLARGGDTVKPLVRGGGFLNSIIPLLDEEDIEIQCQAAKVLGEHQVADAGEPLVKLLAGSSPRVRFFAAMALGKLQYQPAIPHLLAMIRENAGADAYLRHAGVMALAGMNDVLSILKVSKDPSPAVRMAALLALRRLKHFEVVRFLDDTDPAIVLEAARAINDVPIDAATEALAALIENPITDDPILRRVIHANFRLGTPRAAHSLTKFVLDKNRPEPMRVMALQLLGQWSDPTGRDKVTGAWRPLAERNPSPAQQALAPYVDFLLKENVKVEVIRALAGLKLVNQTDKLLAIVKNMDQPALARVEAMRALAAMNDVERLSSAVQVALNDPDLAMLEEAVRQLPRIQLSDTAGLIEKLIFSSQPIPLRQTAILALAKMEGEEIDRILLRCLDDLQTGKLPVALRLEVLEVAAQRKSPLVAEKWRQIAQGSASQHIELLEGGSVKAGRDVFYERQEAGCMKCHMIHGFGGVVGPDLSVIGGQRTPAQLLDSLLYPNKEIAPEFKTVILFTDDDSCIGRILRETDTQVVLMDNEGREVEVDKSAIVARKEALSAMPENVTELLKPRDIRDLVAFLSYFKAPASNTTTK